MFHGPHKRFGLFFSFAAKAGYHCKKLGLRRSMSVHISRFEAPNKGFIRGEGRQDLSSQFRKPEWGTRSLVQSRWMQGILALCLLIASRTLFSVCGLCAFFTDPIPLLIISESSA